MTRRRLTGHRMTAHSAASRRPELRVLDTDDRHATRRFHPRYISWPGHACAYTIGELKIRELRQRAEDRLGDRFDLRVFHDVVLGAGSIPLTVLEKRVNSWINSQMIRTYD